MLDLIDKKQSTVEQMIKNKSDGEILDLSYTYLAGIDLSRANLEGANLTETILELDNLDKFRTAFTDRLASCPTEKRLNLSGMGPKLQSFVIDNDSEEEIIEQAKTIILFNNRLSKIPNFILKNKERIIKLRLSNNAFTEFPNLSGFTKLKNLIFENNNLLLSYINPYRLPPFINSIEFDTQPLALVKDKFEHECKEAGLEITEVFDKIGLIRFNPNEHIKAKR